MKRESKLLGRHPADTGVWTEGIVKALDVRENGVSGLPSGVKAGKMHQLAFEAAEKVLGNCIVVRIAFAGHALQDVELSQLFPVSAGGVLNAAIRMEDEAFGWFVTVISHT